jgi:glycerophosphoryl diester phosphodiesterase
MNDVQPTFGPGPTSLSSRVSRRSLLGGVLATALVGSACRSGAAGPAPTPTVPTFSSLTANTPFYIAHRGGGGDWPEMTAYAYQQAAKIPGLQALEISVNISADGVLVCSHDPTTERMTGTPYRIAKETWATLSQLRVSAADTRDPAQPTQPFTRFDDIVDRYIGSFVLFVEPKLGIAEEALLRRMTALGQPERVVWKQTLLGSKFAAAKNAGFATWGYSLPLPQYLGDNLRRLSADPNLDMLGIPVRAPQPVVQEISGAARQNGKKTIAWAITSNEERDIALGFGAAGLMCSNIAELMPAPAAPPSPN